MGFETTVRSNEGGGSREQDRKETVDAEGNVVRVDQEESACMLYTYDALGNLRQTNALGELKWQIDAAGTVTTMT
ncbi:MAG: hypothetical protein R6V45_08390 [Oceanipulchritudo sp.]